MKNSMRTILSRIAFAAVIAVGLLSLHAANTTADEAYTPASNIKNIMNAINHEKDGLFGMIHTDCKSGSTTSDGFKLMRHRAAMIAEAGNLLAVMDPPKGDKASWIKHSHAFRDAAKGLKKPLIKKKADQVMAQLAEVKKQCDACHKDHRPE